MLREEEQTMKRFLLSTLLIVLFAAQANASLWEVDEATALGFQEFTIGATDFNTDGLAVYNGPVTLVYSSTGTAGPFYGGTQMSGAVGFVGTIGDTSAPTGGTTQMNIFDSTPGLTDTTIYDGITMYVQNDNQSHWNYQLFYVAGGVEYNSGAPVHLVDGTSTWLSTGSPIGGLDLDTITKIGFRIFGHNLSSTTDPKEPSNPDTFHTSVVPVPAAVILGMLGLAVAGWKLRKYA
jgi:hypothetical protein